MLYSVGPWLIVSIPGVNGRYSGKSTMHYLSVNTVETESPGGAAGASIDCDRLEENMHTSPKCPGLLTKPLQINFSCPTFGVSVVGNQAKQLSTDSLRQSHDRPNRYPSIIHHPSPRNKNTQPKRRAEGEGRGCAEARPTAVGGVEKPCQALFGYSACPVPHSSKLKHLSRRGRRKVMRKNFLKEVK